MGLYYVRQHLDRPVAYERILFVDFSSAFNTIIPNLLLPKLTLLSVPTSICQWINSLWGWENTHPAPVRSALELLRAVFSPHCSFSLNTNNCTSKDPSVKLLKFADTTLIGLIQDGDESAYRQEVKELAVWCSLNNLELNTLKTVEMIVDFRRNHPLSPHSPSWTALWLQWSHSGSWAPPSPRTWSGTITLSPLWKRPSRGCISFPSWWSSTCHRSCWNSSTLPSLNPSSAHQYCLVQLGYQIWPQKTTEGSPDCWANHWYNPPHSPRTVLIQSEQKSLQNHSGPSHPAHSLFELLLSGWCYRALSTRTTRHRNSFFSQSIHLMNTWQ